MHHRDRTNARSWGRRMLAVVLGSMFLAPLPVIANAQAADSAVSGTGSLLTLWQPIDPLMSGAGSITSSVGSLTCQNPTVSSASSDTPVPVFSSPQPQASLIVRSLSLWAHPYCRCRSSGTG